MIPTAPPAHARRRQCASLTLLALVVVGAGGCSERSGHDPFALMEGEGIYKAECAACHGVRLEGQPNWSTRQADGTLPAPPLDASGPSWQHPRAHLAAIVKLGPVPPQASTVLNSPQGQTPDMPAYAGKLTDRQIDNVLAWIETQWPPEVLQQRAQRLRQP